MTAFRFAIYIFALVPLFFGVTGMIFGAAQLMEGGSFTNGMDNQFRYLSGIYIGIAVMLFLCAGDVSGRANLFRMVILAVFIGGCARLVSYFTVGVPPVEMMAGMVLELLTPVFLLWQARVLKAADTS